MNIPVILKRAGLLLNRHSPVILTGLSVVGIIGTVAFAISATPKADRIMSELRNEYEEKYQNEETDTNKVPVKEIVKQVVPVYIPTIAMCGVTIACMIGATAIGCKRTAMLAGLYATSEGLLKEYQDKMIKVLGEKKESEARDEIIRERIERNPVTSNEVIITCKGDSLCFDTMSGRYFMSDIEKIRKVENDVNRDIIVNMWMTLNEVYSELGLKPIGIGDDVGWNVDHMLKIRFSSHLADDGRPCLALEYTVHPRHDYRLGL